MLIVILHCNVLQDSRCHGRDSNQAPPEATSEGLWPGRTFSLKLMLDSVIHSQPFEMNSNIDTEQSQYVTGRWVEELVVLKGWIISSNSWLAFQLWSVLLWLTSS
jgi:hypothetical protein